ncbi:MAG TPA: hypothetical protein VFG20_15250, partial [Planctomycetaceae bacterium]|nr:hypothetical protein [Planctomycetaceae bacterium]
FRSLGYYAHGNTSLEHTILRSLPLDSSSTESQRRLLEVASLPEHQNATVDPYLRHRVLSKVWGNSAVRGNTFIVFISAKLFRAAIDGNNNFRIGGPYKEFDATNEPSPELPEYRGVFIVDRTLLEQGYQAGGGGFDSFRPFVTHRRILREP